MNSSTIFYIIGFIVIVLLLITPLFGMNKDKPDDKLSDTKSSKPESSTNL